MLPAGFGAPIDSLATAGSDGGIFETPGCPIVGTPGTGALASVGPDPECAGWLGTTGWNGDVPENGG